MAARNGWISKIQSCVLQIGLVDVKSPPFVVNGLKHERLLVYGASVLKQSPSYEVNWSWMMLSGWYFYPLKKGPLKHFYKLHKTARPIEHCKNIMVTGDITKTLQSATRPVSCRAITVQVLTGMFREYCMDSDSASKHKSLCFFIDWKKTIVYSCAVHLSLPTCLPLTEEMIHDANRHCVALTLSSFFLKHALPRLRQL